MVEVVRGLRTYRMVEGLAGSSVRLMGLTLSIPDHIRPSRRAKTLTVTIPRRLRRGPIAVAVDATGLKVHGAGDWNVRRHDPGKRRTGRKVRLAVDADVEDVLAVEVAAERRTDGQVLAGLLEQIDDPIGRVRRDGAYDTHETDAAAGRRGAGHHPAADERRAVGARSSPHPSAGRHRGGRGAGLETGGRPSSPRSR